MISRTFVSSTTALVWLSLLKISVAAQISINGQTFTSGLAIINSPAQNTPFHAGANIPISIEVSGNGKLPAPALLPGSTLPTHYETLNIYLISAQAKLNVTVSEGEGLLTGETGSVRHLDWPIPSCLPASQYNLTFYETSLINNEHVFAITPIPVSIENNIPSQCSADALNDIQSQPQTSSPLAHSPFLPDKQISVSTRSVYSTQTSDNTAPSGPSPTNSVTASPEPLITIEVISVATMTTTQSGILMTKIFTTTRTTLAPMQTSENTGFFPVNASGPNLSRSLSPLWWIFGLWFSQCDLIWYLF